MLLSISIVERIFHVCKSFLTRIIHANTFNVCANNNPPHRQRRVWFQKKGRGGGFFFFPPNINPSAEKNVLPRAGFPHNPPPRQTFNFLKKQKRITAP